MGVGLDVVQVVVIALEKHASLVPVNGHIARFALAFLVPLAAQFA